MTARGTIKRAITPPVKRVLGPSLTRQVRAVLGNPKPQPQFSVGQVAALPAQEVAKALSLATLYAYGADVEGDIAEFGTMSGATSQALAVAMLAAERWPGVARKRLHLFDSFEGLPKMQSAADLDSPHVKKGVWAPGGCKVLARDELQRVVKAILPADRFTIYPGWFADTVKRLPDGAKFSLVHFDGDLYQSTMDALDPCFARRFISTGAMICFDDWNCNRASAEFGERKAWADLVARYKIQFTMSGDYSWACTRLIVHEYSPGKS